MKHDNWGLPDPRPDARDPLPGPPAADHSLDSFADRALRGDNQRHGRSASDDIVDSRAEVIAD